jgi:hypothetical protein
VPQRPSHPLQVRPAKCGALVRRKRYGAEICFLVRRRRSDRHIHTQVTLQTAILIDRHRVPLAQIQTRRQAWFITTGHAPRYRLRRRHACPPPVRVEGAPGEVAATAGGVRVISRRSNAAISPSTRRGASQRSIRAKASPAHDPPRTAGAVRGFAASDRTGGFRAG